MTMNPRSADDKDRPLAPPEPESEGGMLRWVVAAAAVLTLMVGAYHAYEWLVNDVSQRRAVAEGRAPAPEQPVVSGEPAAKPDLAAVPAVSRPAPAPTPARDPQAPAVVAGGVNKCVRDGHVTYTNEPCPEGSAQPAAAAGMDANGVTGSIGDGVPAVVARPVALANGSDPGHVDAVCRHLAAELERLDFEFRQPLPPPVLDHISSRLNTLRAQSQAAECAPVAKPAADKPDAAGTRPVRKVVEEKAGD